MTSTLLRVVVTDNVDKMKKEQENPKATPRPPKTSELERQNTNFPKKQTLPNPPKHLSLIEVKKPPPTSLSEFNTPNPQPINKSTHPDPTHLQVSSFHTDHKEKQPLPSTPNHPPSSTDNTSKPPPTNQATVPQPVITKTNILYNTDLTPTSELIKLCEKTHRTQGHRKVSFSRGRIRP